MNKLILIGNGFDLAHGMKTSYKDFLESYLFETVNHAFERPLLNHPDFIINFSAKPNIALEIKNGLTIDNVIDRFIGLLPIEDWATFSDGDGLSYKDLQILNPILAQAIRSCSELGWVDIEQIYYDHLINIATSGGSSQDKKIDELNTGLIQLKNILHKYLKSIPTPEGIHYMHAAFDDVFNESDFIDNSRDLTECKQILALNFNYTYTPKTYIDNLNSKFKNKPTTEILNIHGELHNDENPLIFGFGDEMDDHYKILENKKDNRYLDNMKSFGYFRTNNLQKLSRFLDEGNYQVQIMGHSCGLSDRLLLNRVFEHDHCKSIKIFHHRKGSTFEQTNYKELTQNISRHFNKKQKMRDLVVPYNFNNFLPQFKSS